MKACKDLGPVVRGGWAQKVAKVASSAYGEGGVVKA